MALLFRSRTAQGSMSPRSWPLSASSRYFFAFSGSGTEVKKSSQSFPSFAASIRPFSCSRVSGSSRMPCPSRTAGFGWITPRPAFAAGSRRPSQQPVLSEHVADAARRLAQPVLVLDQRDAHVVVAVVAEADAGRDRDLGLLDQPLGEGDGAFLGVEIGDFCPDVHRSLRHLDHPADV